MSRVAPWLVHLPRRALMGGFDVARLARARGDVRDPRELEHRFGLHPHELRFVRDLLERHAQLWAFRCDQRRACGDLVLVDMSARLLARACVVVELKQRARVRESPAHLQLAHHLGAVAELVARGVVGPEPRVVALVGGVTRDDVVAAG